MEISYTLIVALMYVTILSFGLASLLTSLGLLIKENSTTKVSSVHLQWILILLIVHFNMVWHAVYFTSVESWSYHAFLLIELGPALAFFTALILAPAPVDEPEPERLSSHYFSLKNKLVTLFALLQAWAILADYLVGRGLTGSGLFNGFLMVFSALFITSNGNKVHGFGIYLVWLANLASIVLRSLGIIQ